MTEFSTLLWWTLGSVAALGAGFFLYMEYRAIQLRTRVQPVPGGLRFLAHDFSVESLPSAREVKVTAKSNARYSRELLGEKETRAAPLTVSLAMPGLHIEVARLSIKPEEGEATPTGFSRIVFAASDERINQRLGRSGGARAELRLDRVPDSIATAFQQFAGGVRFAVEKVEQQLVAQAAELQQQQQAEQAAADAAAAADPALAPVDPKARAEAQLEEWRAAAGFKGEVTEYGLDDVGRIAWLIDLDTDGGRVVLHAAQRTFYGSLKGATVTLLGADVEISVRDAFWTKEDARLAAFRVLGGTPVEHHRVWKQRLGPVIDQLGGD